MLAPDRTFARRDTALFVLCIALSILQRRAESSRTSLARFELLTAERDSAAVAAQSLPVLLDENRQLRALLGLAERLPTRVISAEVLHQPVPTDGRTLLLSAGRQSGIAPFQAVVAPEGLLGFILTAGPTTSIALTWSHPDFRASAVTLDGSVTGIVGVTADATIREPMLELRGVPYRDSVPAGTPVVTSGLGGVYPRGLPIGTVVGVARQSEGWERVYLVRPAAAPARVSHALIVPAGTVWVGQGQEDSLP